LDLEISVSKSNLLWCLFGINLALVAAVVVPHLKSNVAMAQGVGRPADYMMIPGDVAGSDRGVVYVIDSTNRLISAISLDDASGRVEMMQPLSLDRVFDAGDGHHR
jgi:hypothetical protein